MPWPGGSVRWIIVQYTKRLSVGLIPGLGMYGRQIFDVYVSHSHFSLSLSLSPPPHPLPLSLSLKSINISSGEDLKNPYINFI